MKLKLYWGLGVLIILLIGVSVVLLMRTTNTEPTIIHKGVEPSKNNPPADEPGFKWVWHHNHWDKVPISNTNEVVEHSNVPIAEVSDANPQFTDVGSENSFVNGDFDFIVKLPTDAELPKYNARELSILVYEALTELSEVSEKYQMQSRSLVEAVGALNDDLKDGVIDSKSFWAKRREFLDHERELSRVYQLRRSEQKERIKRITQYRDNLYE